MRKVLTTGMLAAGLLFVTGGRSDDDAGESASAADARYDMRLVYSTDLRGELHPCG
jgi:hypothetical protein